jgi:hypothetical protein
MTRYVIVSVIGGVLFGVLDGLINGNPFAQKLFQVYKPISKTTINIPVSALLYILLTGLAEMVMLGILYGTTLKP